MSSKFTVTAVTDTLGTHPKTGIELTKRGMPKYGAYKPNDTVTVLTEADKEAIDSLICEIIVAYSQCERCVTEEQRIRLEGEIDEINCKIESILKPEAKP